jgi:hypothetical protein
VAHIEGSGPVRWWRDLLWLLMTGAGVLLLIYAALFERQWWRNKA